MKTQIQKYFQYWPEALALIQLVPWWLVFLIALPRVILWIGKLFDSALLAIRKLDALAEFCRDCWIKWIGRKIETHPDVGKQTADENEVISKPSRTAVQDATLIQASFIEKLLAQSDQPQESPESPHIFESNPELD